MNPKTRLHAADVPPRRRASRWPCRGWSRFPSGATQPAAGAAPAAFPKRFAALFMGNGINPKHWWAKGAGADMELSKSLEPLAPLKTQAERHHGCSTSTPTGVGIHPGQTGNILSGAPLQKGAVLRGGISMDQVLAAHFGEETVAAEPGAGLRAADHRLPRDQLLDGLQLAHLLAERDSPVPMEVYPSLAFDSLFDNQGSRRNAEHPRPRQGAGRDAAAARSAAPTRPSSTNT